MFSTNCSLGNNSSPDQAITTITKLPPTGALFAVFLGYNPMQTLLPPQVLQGLGQQAQQNLLSTTFFPSTISDSFMTALSAVFLFSALLTLLAAIFSAIRGPRFIYEESANEQRQEIDRALQRQPLTTVPAGK